MYCYVSFVQIVKFIFVKIGLLCSVVVHILHEH